MPYQFFCYDQHCGFEMFETEAEAMAAAADHIAEYGRGDEWPEAVESVCVGRITHLAECFRKSNVPYVEYEMAPAHWNGRPHPKQEQPES